MEILLSILLLASFAVVLVYMMKGGSTLLSFIVMAILWAVICGVPLNGILTEIIQQPVEKYAPTIMTLVFGSWFGQVLIKTGVVSSLIKRAMELGGDKPILVTIIAILVVSFLFISLYGVGAAMAIGVVILPILLSMGIPKETVSAAFTMGIASTLIVNVMQFNIYAPLFPKGVAVYDGKFVTYGTIAAVIWLAFAIAMAVYNIKKYGLHHNWAVNVPSDAPVKDVNPISYIAPVIPVITIAAFKWPAIPSFILAIIFVFAVTKGGGSKSFTEMLHKTMYDAVTSMGPIVAIWVAVVMFMSAGAKATPILSPLFKYVVPQSPVLLAVFIAILAPLGLYRGIMAPMGAGAAMLALLINSNIVAPVLVFTMYVCSVNNLLGCMDPTNSWNLWTYTNCKASPKEHLKSGLPFAWAASAATVFLSLIMYL